MCEKCFEIDKQIEAYRNIAARTDDPELKAKSAQLIHELIAQKLALHTVRDK